MIFNQPGRVRSSAVYSAGFVGWRIPYRQYRVPTINTVIRKGWVHDREEPNRTKTEPNEPQNNSPVRSDNRHGGEKVRNAGPYSSSKNASQPTSSFLGAESGTDGCTLLGETQTSRTTKNNSRSDEWKASKRQSLRIS